MGVCNNGNNYNSAAIMVEEPKDFESAITIIEELRAKCRYQTEHIIKWKKAYAMQIQQHYRYQKQKTDQMNALTSQLLLLESRLKRKQKQIASIICQRELTILRQQKLIDALSSRLVDHGLETIDPGYTDFDSLNDSDSAVVLEDIDSDCYNSTALISRRKGSCGSGSGGGSTSSDGVTIVRSISDAIESNLNKYSRSMRSNCFLRRPEVLETVYSVEEDPEPQQSGASGTDVAEKRDKFRNRSEKVIVNSLEGQLSDSGQSTGGNTKAEQNNTTSPSSNNEMQQQQQHQQNHQDNHNNMMANNQQRRYSANIPNINNYNNLGDNKILGSITSSVSNIPLYASAMCIYHHNDITNGSTNQQYQHHQQHYQHHHHHHQHQQQQQQQHNNSSNDDSPIHGNYVKQSQVSQVTNFNRVMSNHRSVTKPKDVKYKRINKAKSKSLEELRGRLRHWVEKGSTTSLHNEHPAAAAVAAVASTTLIGSLNGNQIPQTAQSYA
ncbi:probable serine/threonine-protein kinase DDB_G0282963 [Condylostylus longicornis]|uniref:probable serine/threonine-protein kinase DDB_G0282963 n=1 Tax=Condylostylus longicornis TaxID=2530218 RepID=UPI00244E3EEC|nr:probable serine/threonine-protein kinase DDB_G0282963 [Condylostylus longicornis]